MPLTPEPVGEMPSNVQRHDDGRRIVLDVDLTGADEEIATDRHTGERFHVTRNTPCGLGCRCAAEARWLR